MEGLWYCLEARAALGVKRDIYGEEGREIRSDQILFVCCASSCLSVAVVLVISNSSQPCVDRASHEALQRHVLRHEITADTWLWCSFDAL